MQVTRRNLLIGSMAFVSGAVAKTASAQETTKDMPQRKAPTNNTNLALPIEQCWEIIQGVHHPVMGTADKQGIPYALPISTVAYDGKIYFHGVAGHGRKFENIKQNPYVSMVFIGEGHSDKPRLNINKESVVVFGKVRIIESDAEKLKICKELLRFQNPGISEAALDKKIKGSGMGITKALN